MEVASTARPQIETDLRMLIRRTSVEGAQRIRGGALLKLGLEVVQSSVAKQAQASVKI
jgi:hypothetical protein